jgi:hypothetical protein
MGNTPIDSLVAVFGPPISTYTRADMLRDGALVEADEVLAEDAGFRFPVAYTAAVVADCIAWTDEDEARQRAGQSEGGREWDVLLIAALAIRRATNGGDPVLTTGDRVEFTMSRVCRSGSPEAEPVHLVAHFGGDDEGGPCFTLMAPDED